MLVRHQYVSTETQAEPCPLCGGDDVELHVATEMGLHKFYCNACKVEFTIDERDVRNGKMENLSISSALDRWDQRTEAGPNECPFCGSEVTEWPYWYLFDALYCPGCMKRFEFQSHPHSKKSMARTMREFGKRPKK